jgi:NADH-quinone oxidoreductase subunit N
MNEMTTGTGDDVVALLPELLLLAGAVGGLLIGLWTPQHRQWRVRAVAIIACVSSAVAAGVAVPEPDRRVFENLWVIDGTTDVVRIAVALGVAVAVWLASSSLAGHARETEAYVLMLLGGLGTVALAASGDLLLLAAAYLLASVPLYALAGFAKDALGTEATLKYYLMGAFAGVVMLLGVAALVLAAGATGYAELADLLPHAPVALVAVGVLGVLTGVAFKAGAVPVHFWVPDVTAGTTPPMAAYITTIPKIGAVAAAFRLLAEPWAAVPLNVSLLAAVIAAASMTLGNLGAFNQTDVLRLLAYSTISQVGYLFMVVAVAARSELAADALAIYLIGYAVTNFGAFAAVVALGAIRTIRDWATEARQHGWLVVALVVCLLGLVGTPPTAVFVGKLAVFTATWDGGLAWLVVVAALNTVASLFYYLRWIAPAFAGAADTRDGDVAAAGGQDRLAPHAVHRTTVVTATVTPQLLALASLVMGMGAGVWLALTASA